MKILVVDDEHVVRNLIVEILESTGYDVVAATTAEEALQSLDDADVGIVVSDIVMPGLSGLELLEHIRRERPSLPVLFVTGAGTYDTLGAALAGGADGLVLKPFSHAELNSAVASAVERAERTEREMRERLVAPALVAALANAIEARDVGVSGHCERIATIATRIAEVLRVDQETAESVRLGALLHDVGKIGIPDRVLLKPAPFVDEEVALMRTHPLVGDRIIAQLDLLEHVRPVVLHHHERWDGSGYPARLAGDEIPHAARIVAVADSIEAMSARRPYREPLSEKAIVQELRRFRGTQWDPEIVDVALDLIRRGELRFGLDGAQVHERDDHGAHVLFPVLLVEDDPDHALLTTEALERRIADVKVVHARDAVTAVGLCRSSRWALAVLDYNLPDGNGLEVLDQMRDCAPDIPVVMLTGVGSEAVAIEAFRRGARDYVVKDNGYVEELAGRVRSVLEAA